MENIQHRDDLFEKAYHDCMHELYAKAQPEADYDNLIEEYKSGKISKDERIYDRHYISFDEYNYIVNKYIDIYGFKKKWNEYVEVVEEYLDKGGIKDKYIPDQYNENGELINTGHRSYEDVPPIKDQILQYLSKHTESVIKEGLAEDITNIVMNDIKTCKDFYHFDREEEKFRMNIALGASPTSSKETVINWWKENYNVDVKIEDRIPKLFWYYDNGYTDEDLAYEFEDYGKNWKEALKKEWEEELKKREEENQARIEKIKLELKETEEIEA